MSRRKLLSLSLSKGHNCFSCGLESGLVVYNVQPLARLLKLDFETVGGVGHVEMLQRSNLIVFVGGGQAPKFPLHQVMIWDDFLKKFVYEIAFPTPVLSLRLRKNKLIVVLQSSIHVFSFPNPVEKLLTIPTQTNPKGLCEVCTSVDCQLMIYPGPQTGSIQITDLLTIEDPGRASTERLVQAHQHEVVCMTLNQSGTLLASASSKGTLVRVHNTQTRVLLVEFRRGADPANISCINFSQDSAFLCVSSDKGTVHVFAVQDQSLNRKSTLAQVGIGQLSKTVGTYVDSQWDCAQFALPSEIPSLCFFTLDTKSVIAICQDGSFYKYNFTPEGACIRDTYDVFLDIGDSDL